ncbi:MAG: DUF4331 domain-containing protein [Acidimicrobiia bacterium]
MSSHREAPEIAKDPVADSTDVYAFVSPDRPDTVTIITNYVPFQNPAGGPNFYEFGDDVLYRIHIGNHPPDIAPDEQGDIIFEFRFTTEVTNSNTFLYNTGPIGSLDDPNWNRRQTYSVTRVDELLGATELATGLACPPCNIGPRSTPNYATLANAAVFDLPGGGKVFAGQRLDGFWADLGSIFDLGTLRPFQDLHLIPSAAAAGVNALQAVGVHTIAIQVPISELARDGVVTDDPLHPAAVIGVWASASRQQSLVRDGATTARAGKFQQVSRLGNPLFNEVIVPMAEKDRWNAQSPLFDSEFVQYVAHPELAGLLPVLYPGVFPNLAGLAADRADLVAILLTGIPPGIVPGFQNYTGTTPADFLRLNMAIPPAASPNPLGVVGGDLAGFPNGRRVTDDVVTIELRAVAGVTYPLVDPTFTPDAAAGAILDGTSPPPGFLAAFPYLGHPVSGYDVLPLSV